jgi:predicted enzyme related to lactoylglutathione lyase
MTTTIDKAAIVGLDLAGCFTSNPERSIAFYRDVLGMEPTEVDSEGRGAEFTLADGQTFGVWNPGSQGPHSGAITFFAVKDIDAAVARIRANGGKIEDPRESPVCHMAFGVDPDGNSFAIHCRKA